MIAILETIPLLASSTVNTEFMYALKVYCDKIIVIMFL